MPPANCRYLNVNTSRNFYKYILKKCESQSHGTGKKIGTTFKLLQQCFLSLNVSGSPGKIQTNKAYEAKYSHYTSEWDTFNIPKLGLQILDMNFVMTTTKKLCQESITQCILWRKHNPATSCNISNMTRWDGKPQKKVFFANFKCSKRTKNMFFEGSDHW